VQEFLDFDFAASRKRRGRNEVINDGVAFSIPPRVTRRLVVDRVRPNLIQIHGDELRLLASRLVAGRVYDSVRRWWVRFVLPFLGPRLTSGAQYESRGSRYG
jgi:hypothetical protein